jgi:hypothetical protein
MNDGNLVGESSSLVSFASRLLLEKAPSKKYGNICNTERLLH